MPVPRCSPRLLALFCAAVSTGLARLPEIQIPTLSRCADSALWIAAAAPALGVEPAEILAAISDPDPSPVVAAVAAFMQDFATWEDTASELLECLPRACRPAGPRLLSMDLREGVPALRSLGFAVNFTRTTGGRRRLIRITRFCDADAPAAPMVEEEAA